MPDIYDGLVCHKKFILNYWRYTKRGYFLTRGSDVKLKDTFLDNNSRISYFVCCMVGILDRKTRCYNYIHYPVYLLISILSVFLLFKSLVFLLLSPSFLFEYLLSPPPNPAQHYLLSLLLSPVYATLLVYSQTGGC